MGCLYGLYVPDWQFEVPTINFHGTSLNNGSELFIDRFVDLSGILTSSSVAVLILVGCENICGIFAYLNYCVSRERRYILVLLFNGLRRLEYRGYDSAGISIDSHPINESKDGEHLSKLDEEVGTERAVNLYHSK